MPKQVQTEILSGARDVLPLAVGVALYGTAFGLLAAQVGFDELQVGVMGALVFGGASQIVAVERVAAGAGAIAAITAGFALNLRLVLITASIREVYADRPAWQIALGAHFTSDESWALMLAQRARGQDAGYWYLVGAGAGLLVTWLVATVGGVFFAAVIPEPRAFGMDLAFTAAFIAIARSLWRGKKDLLPWLVALATVALTAATGVLAPSWAIMLGGMAGAASAAWQRDV